MACRMLIAVCLLAGCSSDSRSQAQSYARDNLPCANDNDCCVVFDNCLDQGMIVAARDQATVAGLLAKASQDNCLACINPPIQARCVDGLCTGLVFQESSGTCDYSTLSVLATDHCGSTAMPAACVEIKPGTGKALRIGCGNTVE